MVAHNCRTGQWLNMLYIKSSRILNNVIHFGKLQTFLRDRGVVGPSNPNSKFPTGLPPSGELTPFENFEKKFFRWFLGVATFSIPDVFCKVAVSPSVAVTGVAGLVSGSGSSTRLWGLPEALSKPRNTTRKKVPPAYSFTYFVSCRTWP